MNDEVIQSEPSPEVQTFHEVAVEFPEDGTKLVGTDGHEVVVQDVDENGTVVGWHKEVVEGP